MIEDAGRKFEYGRDLYIAYFQDDSFFINLGYSEKQKALAKKALSLLMAAEMHVRTGTFNYASFAPERIDSDEICKLQLLECEGYHLRADSSREFGQQMGMFGEGEFDDTVVIAGMIPADLGYEDLAKLVKNLYEGSEYFTSQSLKLKPETLLTNLRSKINPTTATFQAVWMDERTKLELVVKSNFRNQDFIVAGGISNEPSTTLDTWRRFPEFEYQGQIWRPFGRKPNISNKAAQSAFARSKAKVLGSFASENSQA